VAIPIAPVGLTSCLTRTGRWAAAALESVASAPGSLDRAHHHPRFSGWEPGKRVFVDELSTDPVGWLRDRFAGSTMCWITRACPSPLPDLEGFGLVGARLSRSGVGSVSGRRCVRWQAR
jgi:hypothetical protein